MPLSRLLAPLFAISAVLTGLLASAAPARAESVDFTPVTTLTSGGCVARQELRASFGSGSPGRLAFIAPATRTLFGLPSISSSCAFQLTLRWRNVDTGATGSDTARYVVPDSCDVLYCSVSWAQTGSGRVVVEATTDHPHTAGRVEVVVP